jgi:hypothetical protein
MTQMSRLRQRPGHPHGKSDRRVEGSGPWFQASRLHIPIACDDFAYRQAGSSSSNARIGRLPDPDEILAKGLNGMRHHNPRSPRI